MTMNVKRGAHARPADQRHPECTTEIVNEYILPNESRLWTGLTVADAAGVSVAYLRRQRRCTTTQLVV